jgi:hypothetical protein
MAFVVVTHQHPDFPSLLPELLSKVSRLKVVAVRDGMKVEPDHVYVSTPGGYLALLGGTLHRMEGGAEESPRLPIDYFFRSLAEERKERAVCIILSGMDSDGDQGRVGDGDGPAGALGEAPGNAGQRDRHRPGRLRPAARRNARPARRLRAGPLPRSAP